MCYDLPDGVGLGENYVDGDWECEALDEMITRLLRANLAEAVQPLNIWLRRAFAAIVASCGK